jgi:hypothetical protein
MIDRRGFFSLLSAGVAGLLLPDTLIVEPAKFKAVVPETLSVVNLKTITEALNAEFERQMGTILTVHSDKGFRVGDYGFEKQFNVSMALPHGETRDIHERFINPAATALANSAKNARLYKFGWLMAPVTVESTRVGALRGVVWPYCVYCDNTGGNGAGCSMCGRWDSREVLRFDILGGHV